MSKKAQHPVIMIEDDYRALRPFATGPNVDGSLSLAEELERAIIVRKEAFPVHAIRLNSQVSLLEAKSKKRVSFAIVLPNHADIHKQKISALAPIAIAVIGFREGEDVTCKLPGGTRRFQIETVVNSFA